MKVLRPNEVVLTELLKGSFHRVEWVGLARENAELE
jgi:hypothetical protein